MIALRTRNSTTALVTCLDMLKRMGIRQESRNGAVTVFPEAFVTTYEKPRERVMTLPGRDCNPYFHFMEALWMLNGQNDVATVEHYNSNMANYSDDGEIFHGAYGHRWRGTFGIDQMLTIINLLKDNPFDRRTVMQMWDANLDLAQEGKDFPCNLTVAFRVDQGRLDMSVFNRSNDIVFGAYGANSVHFSMLQEFMAAAIGVPVGVYEQISNNLHLYDSVLNKVEGLTMGDRDNHIYEDHGEEAIHPMVSIDHEAWLAELAMFMENPYAAGFRERFFRKVAIPMHRSWEAWKNQDNKREQRIQEAMFHAEDIGALDWRIACMEWLDRRSAK